MTANSGVPELRALAHPLRLRLLSLLTAQALTASEAARELGESQANVSYHLRQLHGANFVDLVEETTVRGGRAKRYRHNPSSDTEMRADTVDDYTMLASALTHELHRRIRYRSPGSQGAMTDAELWLPNSVWERVLSLANEIGHIVHEEAQPPGTQGTIHANTTLMLFEMDDSGLER